MTWLSDETLERRARRRLAKYGLKVKYRREGERGWYTVYANEDRPHIDWPEDGEYPDICKVLELTEYLHERYSS